MIGMDWDSACLKLGLDPERAPDKLERYDIMPVGNVLEVGAGNGLLSHWISYKYGLPVTALDNYAGRGNKPDAMSVNTELGKLLDTDVSIIKKPLMGYTGDHDTVIVDMTLHHIAQTRDRVYDNDGVVANMKRIYNTGCSVLYIAEVLPFTKEYFRYDKIIGNVEPESKHYPGEWIDCCERAGFSRFSVRYLLPAVAMGKVCKKYAYIYVIEVQP